MGSREYSDATPRKSSLDNSFFEGLSPHDRNGLRDECARTALALTALFDGEANIEEALLARTHRAECAQCDSLWHSWSQQNQMLRSLSAPLPPGLLLRILTAIRLLAVLPQMRARLEAKTTHFEPPSALVSDARLLPEVVFISGANPFAPRRHTQNYAPRIEAPRELPPLDPMSPLPPANLRNEILRRTVGEIRSSQKNDIALLQPKNANDTLAFEPQCSTAPRRARRLSARVSSTLVPMLAAWLIFLSGPSGLWTPLIESAAPPQELQAAPVVERSAVAKAPKPIGKMVVSAALKNAAIETVTLLTEENLNSTSEPEGEAEKQVSTETSLTLPLQNSKATAPAPLVAPVLPVSVPKQVPTQAVQSATLPVPPLKAPIAKTAAQVASVPRLAPVVHHPATTAADMEIHTRPAVWSAPSSDIPTTRRALWNAAVSTHMTAPQTDEAGDNLGNDGDAETLEHVNRLNDSRPDDVRNVLDDYRASLLAENPEDEADLTGPQG